MGTLKNANFIVTRFCENTHLGDTKLRFSQKRKALNLAFLKVPI